MGLKSDTTADAVTFPHTPELDRETEGFYETIQELLVLTEAAVSWGETLAAAGGGEDAAWDTFYLVGSVASASTIHERLPGVYGLGKILNIVTGERETIEAVALKPLGDWISGNGFSDQFGDNVVRGLIESSGWLVFGIDQDFRDKLGGASHPRARRP